MRPLPDATLSGATPPHWWAPCALNHLLHRAGCPLGSVVLRATAARRRLDGANPTPVVLLRVDDYPHWSVPVERFWEFHQHLTRRNVPYLVAATPFLVSDPAGATGSTAAPQPQDWLNLAAAVQRRELEVGLHGLTHRARSGPFASEFDGVMPFDAKAGLASGWQFLSSRGCHPVAFVPPFNRFPPHLWDALPRECGIVCLGPESLRDVPLLWSPARHRSRATVYSLPPFYGRARHVLRALQKGHWLERAFSVMPITLHWTWELEDRFAGVAELASCISGYTARWSALAASDPDGDDRVA